MIWLVAGGYGAIGLGLALVAARRRAAALEVVALLVVWPLYAPLWFERPAPSAWTERAALLATALDRADALIDRMPVTASDAPVWMARLAAAHERLRAIERALPPPTRAEDERPVVAQARAAHRRQRAALAAIEACFADLAVLVRLADWVADAHVELARVVTTLAGHLDTVDPADPRGAE